jgi:hypothetical protein
MFVKSPCSCCWCGARSISIVWLGLAVPSYILQYLPCGASYDSLRVGTNGSLTLTILHICFSGPFNHMSYTVCCWQRHSRPLTPPNHYVLVQGLILRVSVLLAATTTIAGNCLCRRNLHSRTNPRTIHCTIPDRTSPTEM